MAPRDKGKRRASTSTQNATSSLKPSLILQRGKRSFLIALPDSFAHAMAETRRLFPKLNPDTLVLEREVAGFGWVRLTVSGWESEAAALAHSSDGPAVVRVDVDSGSDDDDGNQPDKKRKRCTSESLQSLKVPTPATNSLPPPPAGPVKPVDDLTYALTLSSWRHTLVVNVKRTTKMRRVFKALADKVNVKMDDLAIESADGDIRLHDTFADVQARHELDITWTELDFEWRVVMRGGKPVIYLFPPTPLDSASVSVTLTPEWHFSALYPVVDPVKGVQGETTASWTVCAQPDGSLVDLASGLELKYLFWEAEAYRTNSSVPSHLAFDPSNPSLDASNGCALPFATFLAHLDKTLAALSLHTTARNDFVTYWLSHFVRIRDAGQHIGFRFLAQSDYERAARLDVDPKPDVVTRVFLLFKGVGTEEASEWKKPDEVDWVKEVGVQVDKIEDKSLFRVLEWGGMEVV